MRYELYIDGSQVELDASSLILYNYTRDEASNPTVIKNSYSQKVTIPGTPANNKTFSHFYRSDYVTGTGRFNPIAKTPFEIRNEMSEVVESGYIKLENVARKGADVVSYSVSLFGGLGGFFYEMTYDSDGNEKTLADMNYRSRYTIAPAKNIGYPATAETVNDCWDALANGGYGDVRVFDYRLLNFIPCNNGLPACNFDAKKAIYRTASQYQDLDNITLITTVGGVTYRTKSDANDHVLLEMDTERTEWEMQDLRAYLQRPAISVKGLLDTIADIDYDFNNTGDYTFVLDSNVFNSSNKWYYLGWMTLPMFDRDNIAPSGAKLSDYLAGTKSPAAYLIGLAKMFGLVFLYDGPTKTVTLTSRDRYYNNSTPVDLSDRIDNSSISIVPTNISKRWYQFQSDMAEAKFTDAYADKYGKEYGAQWVNTGYQFNEEKKNLLDGSPFKGAADVLESSLAYMTDFKGTGHDQYFKFDMLGTVKWTLYDDDDNTLEMSSLRAYNADEIFGYQSSGNGGVMPMPQFHDSDNKSKDGSGVLLFFDQMVSTRAIFTEAGVDFHYPFFLTDDVAAMTTLAGCPCWIASGIRKSAEGDVPYVRKSLPSFRRWAFDSDRVMVQSMDFGNVQETAVPETFVSGCGVYHKFWQKYIQDRCHVDTRTITCKVDLTGMTVDGDTLRRFYWFDNALWVLSKIKNHCYTKQAPTECEFIKVQDVDNYNNGQII